MSRGSRGSVYRPRWSTRLRLASKANRWLHKSCASSVTQDNETKTTLSNVQMSWTIMSVSQLKTTIPGQNSGPMILLNARNSSDFINPVSPLIAGLHSTLPTCVKFTIFSKHQLICCITTSLNKRHFSNNPLSNQRLPYVFHCNHGNHHEKKLVSKRKSFQHFHQTDALSHSSSDGLPFTIIIIIRWPIILLSYYAGQYS